jgi:hypothetical protein
LTWSGGKGARKKHLETINSDDIRMRLLPMFFEVGWLHDLSPAILNSVWRYAPNERPEGRIRQFLDSVKAA